MNTNNLLLILIGLFIVLALWLDTGDNFADMLQSVQDMIDEFMKPILRRLLLNV